MRNKIWYFLSLLVQMLGLPNSIVLQWRRFYRQTRLGHKLNIVLKKK